jgi:hypothetical protein
MSNDGDKMTLDEVRDRINSLAEEVESTAGAVGTDLQRDAGGFIIDTSDLGIAVRELERTSSVLSRLSYRISNG